MEALPEGQGRAAAPEMGTWDEELADGIQMCKKVSVQREWVARAN